MGLFHGFVRAQVFLLSLKESAHVVDISGAAKLDLPLPAGEPLADLLKRVRILGPHLLQACTIRICGQGTQAVLSF